MTATGGGRLVTHGASRPSPALPARALLIDVRAGDRDPLLRRVSGRPVATRRALPAAGDVPAGTIAIGVRGRDDGKWSTGFAAWAHRAAVPLLEVAIESPRTVIGPLTLPGWAGCGHCAHNRMLAAGHNRVGPADPPQEAEASRAPAVAATALTSVLRAIGERGLEGSGVLGRVSVVDGSTGEVSTHRFVPLAHCPVCGGAASVARPAAGPEGLELPPDDPLAGWVDPVCGVIPALTLDPRAADSSTPFVVTAAAPRIVRSDGSVQCLPVGWGKGMTPSRAVLCAVGEAIERYSASVPDPARVLWRRPDELPGDRLDPRQLALYDDDQYHRPGFPYARFDPAVRHPWIRGRWLGTATEVWVPAVLALLSLPIGPENLFCQGTSNGLAASTTTDDAALRAILELVERDAMMAAWLTGAGGLRVDLDGALAPDLAGIVRAIEAQGASAVEIHLLPDAACGTVALALALGDGRRWPGVTIGMAAGLDPTAAVRQAILELGQTGPHLNRLMRAHALPVPAEPAAVREMMDHAAYYFPPERAAAFDRLRAGRETVSLAALPSSDRSLTACGTALARAGVRVALVDVTSPDVATSPFRVVRAVSPDLQPISFGHGLDRLPVERIRARLRAAGPPGGPIHPIS